MKKLFSIISLVFCMLMPVNAKSIVGKWYCSGAFLDSLRLASEYPGVSGYFKFNKDGTFISKINGSGQASKSSMHHWFYPALGKTDAKYRNIYIKVKGTYKIENNTITTQIAPNGIYCYIDPGFRISGTSGDFQTRMYEDAEFHAELRKNYIKTELTYLWEWNAKPLTLTDEGVKVGDEFNFCKKRRDVIGPVLPQWLLKGLHVSNKEFWDAERSIRIKKSSKIARRYAVKTMEKAAVKDSSVRAMNTLGFAYMNGIGVEKDSARALMWLEKAIAGGNDRACHTLGTMYKNGKAGVYRDFKKAYGYFCQGAENGDRACIYEKGCMLYKGLGCVQDYSEAVKCFLTVANSSLIEAYNGCRPQAWRMLGICCRNGYGLVKDTAFAEFCLTRASRTGCREARKELAWHEETHMSGEYLHDARYRHLPDSMPGIRPGEGGIGLAAGNYEGFLVMYDWSGKYILMEKPLNMAVTVDGRKADGRMTVGTEEVEFSAEIAEDGSLKFMGGDMQLDGRYGAEGRYILADMPLHEEDGRLTGRLNTYSAKQKEPGRPVYVELKPLMAQAKGRQ